jgi:hypothetical protein
MRNVELHDLNSSPNIIRMKDESPWGCSTDGRQEECIQDTVEKARRIGRPRHAGE